MTQNITYGLGGVDPNKPHDNALEMWDDSTRTYTDLTTDPPTTRPYDDDENTAADDRAAVINQGDNAVTLGDRLAAGLVSNRTYLGLLTTTSAQNVAQIKSLTRQVSALARLLTEDLTATD